MRLRTLLPAAFGKFHRDAPIVLQDGLNIVRGENEAGKSTLGAFILGMFYGFKKEGKTRISRSPEFDRYKPWSGSDYRGSITYEEGGRVYRVERSFEPDTVRIFDDATGEDLTRSFSQDSRKEYDFAARHLGLSQKEFRNTVWIGQLGSPQEPGLGTEIQGKLESILGGGAEDVSLGRALAVLNEEKAKLKSPRSTKARLDLLGQEIDHLEDELESARAREEQVRDWLAEAYDLSREKAQLQTAVDEGVKDLRSARYSLLNGILSQAQEIEARLESLRERVKDLEWARDLPANCEGSHRSLTAEKSALRKRIAEIETERAALAEKREAALSRVEALRQVESAGVDEVAVAALFSRYSQAKGQALRGERGANEARKELRVAEEEGRLKGYPTQDLDEDILRRAEDYQQNCLLAEKEKDHLEVETEKARAAVSSTAGGGASTLIYAVALVALGLAVVCTVMALPVSIPLFVAAVGIFAFGVYRHGQAAKTRRAAQEVLSDKEREVASQIERIDNARKVLTEFLSTVGARSVEELRALAREIASFRARLKAAQDRFDQVQKSWFEASSEFSTVEKELLNLLRTAGVIQAGDPVTDASVDRLRRNLRDLQSQRNGVKTVDDRLDEVIASSGQQTALLEAASAREADLFRAAGVESGEELLAKIAANEEYVGSVRTIEEMTGRERALLSGRDVAGIRDEVATLSQGLGGSRTGGAPVSDKDYENMRRVHDDAKARLADVNQRLAGLEKGIRLRGEEGRGSATVEEELARQRSLEEELTLERDALDLAYGTINELSASIRREFAPALNNRVGAVLEGITLGRYNQIRVSPDLEMSVIHPDTLNQTPVAALSGGTLDQCYFALRVAIAEAITKKEQFPFFLDDSFVQYDDRRLEGALSLLAALAERHQILVFSCHGREEEIAGRMGLKYNRVAL